MKTKQTIILIATVMLTPMVSYGGKIEFSFGPVEDFRDFSVSGLTETRTLPLFEAEIAEEMESSAKKYLGEDETLHIHITDIDMAGDIQPWRNYRNADIRYIENLYPPRLKFTYEVKDGDGNITSSGEENIADLSFMMNVLAPMQSRQKNFFYESTLLRDWMRKNYRDRTQVAAK